MIETLDIETWRTKPYPRRFKRGSAPCYGCQQGKHERCRPRTNNMLCSCSCRIAEGIRVEAAEFPHLSEQEQVQELDRLGLIPRTRARTIGDVTFPRLNRQDIAEDAT